ncbi:type II toxin-antitoxin system MqsR family toxin [Shewanella goraebulensis]|uniref:type II toxin-antitoxin system MqsR family toxin n=1 Tax=Shewanella goraebulensis TaxID=3050637 RepID=UPI002550C504|nr:type II toxin-antitoxin system MqsR family toxin [Shewanella goraebulensis]
MPHYDLAVVQSLASDPNKIIMMGGSRRDRTNLGYSMNDVQRCIQDLTEECFHKTHSYDKGPADAYRVDYLLDGQDHVDHLYVKFYIDKNNQLAIKVLSFHMDR